MLSRKDNTGRVTESTEADELRAENAKLREELTRVRHDLSMVEQDRDYQHAAGKDLQAQLDRERAKNRVRLQL